MHVLVYDACAFSDYFGLLMFCNPKRKVSRHPRDEYNKISTTEFSLFSFCFRCRQNRQTTHKSRAFLSTPKKGVACFHSLLEKYSPKYFFACILWEVLSLEIDLEKGKFGNNERKKKVFTEVGGKIGIMNDRKRTHDFLHFFLSLGEIFMLLYINTHFKHMNLNSTVRVKMFSGGYK